MRCSTCLIACRPAISPALARDNLVQASGRRSDAYTEGPRLAPPAAISTTRSWSPARMEAVFHASRNSRSRCVPSSATLIAAVALNRYAAMAVFKLLLYSRSGMRRVALPRRRDAA